MVVEEENHPINRNQGGSNHCQQSKDHLKLKEQYDTAYIDQLLFPKACLAL